MNDTGMNRKQIVRYLPLICIFISVLMLALSIVGRSNVSEIDKVAEATQEKLVERMETMDGYISRIMETETGKWPDIGNIPEDIVIYRYVNDSLQSWNNQFSVVNDDISSRLEIQRMTSLKNRIISPLTDITENVAYTNIGPKWYVTKAVYGERNDRILAGIEVKNTLIDDIRRNENGVNPYFNLPAQYSVLPLANSGGSEVSIDGIPLFKVIAVTDLAQPFFNNSALKWMALLFFAIALIIYLACHRKFKVYFAVTGVLTALMVISYIWARQITGTIDFFSPTVYADGPYLNSIGILIITNTFLTMIVLCTYMMRHRLLAAAVSDRGKAKARTFIYGMATLITSAGTAIYIHSTLKSIILNSNINLELYKLSDSIAYSSMIYLSYTGLVSCILLQLHALEPVAKRLFNIRFRMLGRTGIIIFAAFSSLYFTWISSTLGFRKEIDRVTVWANRLAVDRNLALEIQLRTVEESIANDQLLSALSALDNTSDILQNRISEYYLSRIRQDNLIEVRVFKDNDKKGNEFFNNILRIGTPISDGSRFMFLTDGNGHSTYAGAFFFWSEEKGMSRMLLTVEPNSNREDRGYNSILGRFSKPGEINIPSMYSYAKYLDGRLVSYKGNYPYPTISDSFGTGGMGMYESEAVRFRSHVHFMSMVSEEELIVISRKQRSGMMYFISWSYLFMIISALLMLILLEEKKTTIFKRNYFRTRINTILFTSSFLVLLSMTVISVIFVYKRNETNMYDLMSTRISTVQALTESRVRQAKTWQDLVNQELYTSIENIGNNTKSDITLYNPEGKVFYSTSPEVFEKQILGTRINEEAYKEIRYKNQRYFIHREKIADYRYWMLYAPIFNDSREMIAIICTPYTERNYDFRREALFHAALIINLFLLLLICTLFFSTHEVNQMFKPLIEMGRKMANADIHNPEYIIYKRDDEISSLVDTYNLMVQDLAESTQKLASAERDKAWSEMARQVAHEIKNPLTPIKLEIQRLIRLKQKGNPAWEEKFDKVSAVVLEHIDILTDTANEFSTFAKLYSEEPVLMDLDKTLKEQLLIFDNKENIRISYIGMPDAFVMAPKPQLIRVFVNLITNAIQAVEIHQNEVFEETGETVPGKIVICLRNSTKDGYYDIVFDDNGPGVKEENQHKLFTPNFTTKTGGTGLGLAICRNIITKCEGEISYRKSYALGGASFIVTLPRHKE